jgi:hypothetical protein
MSAGAQHREFTMPRTIKYSTDQSRGLLILLDHEPRAILAEDQRLLGGVWLPSTRCDFIAFDELGAAAIRTLWPNGESVRPDRQILPTPDAQIPQIVEPPIGGTS